MGKIVNGGVQMNMMFDIMKQNGGKIDLDKGITFEILPDKDIMSLVKQLGLQKEVKTPYDFLQLVNSVLRRMREDETSSVESTTDSYVKLIGEFVNDARRIVEDAWDC